MKSAEFPEITEYKERFIERVRRNFFSYIEQLSGEADSWSLRRPVVAISGGPDSTALLIALSKFAAASNIKLRPVHVNHKLRSEESETDEEFCKNLCKGLGLGLAIKSLGDELSANPSEDELRKARYAKLLEYARTIEAGLILTGHTVDDQLETMLFRLFRGTSPSGLLGMSPVRRLTPTDRIWLMRPLLALEKIDCLKFLAECETTAREDSSNALCDYDRNYIRHQVIPVIESRFGQWKRSLLRLHDVVSVEEDYFNQVVEDEISKVRSQKKPRSAKMVAAAWELPALQNIHRALLRRMIARQFRDLEMEPSYERISYVTDLIDNAVDPDFTGAVTLSDWLEARVKGGLLIFRYIDNDSEARRYNFLSGQNTQINFPDLTSERGSCSNLITWLNKSLRISRYEDGDADGFPGQRELTAHVDLDFQSQPVCVRMRRAGDIIQPFGMENSVRLKKYLHTHKGEAEENLPEFQRDLRTVIVVADQKEVLWVPGFGLSERLRARRKPTYVMEWLDLASGGPILA